MNELEAEALTSANALIRNHSGREWKERESRVRHGHPKMPYHLGRTKLAKDSASSDSFPPGVAPGGGSRKWALYKRGSKTKYRGDNDPTTTWTEALENVNPEPGNAESMTIQNERNANDWNQNYWNWRHGNNYWAGRPGWGQNPGPTAKGMGRFAKVESQNQGVEHQ